jgi:hypothetical protein
VPTTRTRTRTRTAQPSPQPRPRRQPNPTGRVDIALSRLLEYAVNQYADVPVRAVYNTLQKQINMGIAAVVGPRTSVGVTAKQAVSMIRLVAGEIADNRGRPGPKGAA